jgi:hypothetical protein
LRSTAFPRTNISSEHICCGAKVKHSRLSIPFELSIAGNKTKLVVD